LGQKPSIRDRNIKKWPFWGQNDPFLTFFREMVHLGVLLACSCHLKTSICGGTPCKWLFLGHFLQLLPAWKRHFYPRRQNPPGNWKRSKWPLFTSFLGQKPSFWGQNRHFEVKIVILGSKSSFWGQKPSFRGQNRHFGVKNVVFGVKTVIWGQNRHFKGGQKTPYGTGVKMGSKKWLLCRKIDAFSKKGHFGPPSQLPLSPDFSCGKKMSKSPKIESPCKFYFRIDRFGHFYSCYQRR